MVGLIEILLPASGDGRRRVYRSAALTRDPIEYAGGINLHAFVESSPVGMADPWALAPPMTSLFLSNPNYKPPAGILRGRPAATTGAPASKAPTPAPNITRTRRTRGTSRITMQRIRAAVRESSRRIRLNRAPAKRCRHMIINLRRTLGMISPRTKGRWLRAVRVILAARY